MMDSTIDGNSDQSRYLQVARLFMAIDRAQNIEEVKTSVLELHPIIDHLLEENITLNEQAKAD